jgi:hypothetical protein
METIMTKSAASYKQASSEGRGRKGRRISERKRRKTFNRFLIIRGMTGMETEGQQFSTLIAPSSQQAGSAVLEGLFGANNNTFPNVCLGIEPHLEAPKLHN